MAKDKPLTKTDLIKTLKDVGVATKDDVRLVIKEEIKNQELASKNDIAKSERRLIRRIGQVEKNLRQSIVTLAETTSTRKEFNELKQQEQSFYSPLP